jgi:hypothetical protein
MRVDAAAVLLFSWFYAENGGFPGFSHAGLDFFLAPVPARWYKLSQGLINGPALAGTASYTGRGCAWSVRRLD